MPNVINYGTNHKFNLSTPKIVTAAFGEYPQARPGGQQAIHINSTEMVRLTNNKTATLNKAGERAIAHLPVRDLVRRSGADFNVLEDSFTTSADGGFPGVRFRHASGAMEVMDIMDFNRLLNNYDENGTFTRRTEDQGMIICPSLTKPMKGNPLGKKELMGRGIIRTGTDPVQPELTEEEMDLAAEMMAKFALDYFVMMFTTTKMGLKVTDVHTRLLPEAFKMAEQMIRRKAGM